jgi:hypothetical protein
MSIGFVLFQQFQSEDPLFGIEFYDASVLYGKTVQEGGYFTLTVLPIRSLPLQTRSCRHGSQIESDALDQELSLC